MDIQVVATPHPIDRCDIALDGSTRFNKKKNTGNTKFTVHASTLFFGAQRTFSSGEDHAATRGLLIALLQYKWNQSLGEFFHKRKFSDVTSFYVCYSCHIAATWAFATVIFTGKRNWWTLCNLLCLNTSAAVSCILRLLAAHITNSKKW